CAITRPIWSCGPPAANGMTMVIGWVGKVCAIACSAVPSSAAQPIAKALLRIGGSPEGVARTVARVGTGGKAMKRRGLRPTLVATLGGAYEAERVCFGA